MLQLGKGGSKEKEGKQKLFLAPFLLFVGGEFLLSLWLSCPVMKSGGGGRRKNVRCAAPVILPMP